MKMVDTKGDLGDFVMDDKRKIPKAHLNKVCKIYKKDKTCRFIVLSQNGYVCMKGTPMGESLTQMSIAGKIVARSDNCDGRVTG